MIRFFKEVLSFFMGRKKLHLAMMKIFRSRNVVRNRNKKVLFFPMGYFESAVAWEIIMMKALEVRGGMCKSFVCESFVSACEVRFVDADSMDICSICRMRTKQLFSFSGVDYFKSSKYVADEDLKNAIRMLPGDNALLRKFSYDGIPFGELVRVSLLHYLRVGADQTANEFFSAYRRFIHSALLLYTVQKRILDDYKPDCIVVINGLFYPGALLMLLAKARGIRCVTYESGYLNDRLVFSDAGPAVWFPIDKIWDRFKDMPLSDGENKILEDYLMERRYGRRSQVQLWNDPDFDEEKIKVRLNIPRHDKVFCIFTNILWDSAVIGCDEAFESMVDWVRATINYFKEQPDNLLIIRVHPAEIKIPGQESREKILDSIRDLLDDDYKNIVVVGPDSNISSYVLMHISDVVLVNTSITGLEAACMGRPVVVVGKTHYKNKGFTYDVHNAADYFKTVKELSTGMSRESRDISESARRYAHVFFFRYMVEFPFVKQLSGKYNRNMLAFDSIEALKPGRSASLDSICSFILGEGEIIGHE